MRCGRRPVEVRQMIQRRNTATKRQTLLHCGALAAILGVVVGLIFLVHPGCVYGAD